MDRLRVGFIGAGANTRLRHIPGFAAIRDVELTAVANRSIESATLIAAEFGIGRVETDWRRIVTADDIDAVCIGTWPDTHAEFTCAALAAGKSVLVEARMSRSVHEAEQMVYAASSAPRSVAQIVPSPFTLIFDGAIREAVDNGELGEIRAIEVSHFTGANLNPDAPLSWRQDFGISGVNTLSLGICYEPLLRWMPGDGSVQAAQSALLVKERRGPDGALRAVSVPDSVSVFGEWTGGAKLTLNISSVVAGFPRCEFCLIGSEGTLRYDVLSGSASIAKRDGRLWNLAPDLPGDGWRVERDFVHSVRTGAPVDLTDFATGRRYMDFTEAAWRAWQAPQVL